MAQVLMQKTGETDILVDSSAVTAHETAGWRRAKINYASDQRMVVPAGSEVDFVAGLLKINGVDKTSVIDLGLAALATGKKIAFGQATTVTASDTIATGLATVGAVIAVLEDTPVLTCSQAQGVMGNQSGAPAAGSIYIKTSMATSAIDATPIPATTFGKKVNWIALGT